jgi:hypothetical protein
MKFIAFWRYDIFPFCIWGELLKADEDSFCVKGYDGRRFSNKIRIAFLPEVQAKAVIAKLEKLTADKAAADAKFKSDAKNVLEGIS